MNPVDCVRLALIGWSPMPIDVGYCGADWTTYGKESWLSTFRCSQVSSLALCVAHARFDWAPDAKQQQHCVFIPTEAGLHFSERETTKPMSLPYALKPERF